MRFALIITFLLLELLLQRSFASSHCNPGYQTPIDLSQFNREPTRHGFLKGTEEPLDYKPGTNEDIVRYDKYTILAYHDDEGTSNISVYRQEDDLNSRPFFDVALHMMDLAEETHFYLHGILDNWLFIDQGTSADARHLYVIDIQTARILYQFDYSHYAMISGNMLIHFTPLPEGTTFDTANIICEDEDNNQSKFSKAYEQGILFNLSTSEITKTNQIICAWRE